MTMALRKNVMLLLLGVCFADLPQDTTMHGAQDATNVNEKSVPTSAGHLRGSVLKTITTEQDSAIQGAVVKSATAETQTGVPLSLKKSGIPSGAAPSCPCGKRCTQTRRITAGQFACVRWECSKCLKMLVPEESQSGNALDGNAVSLMSLQNVEVENATAEAQTGVPLSLKKSGIPSGAAPSCPCGKRCTQTRRITAGQFACVRWECSKCLKMLVPEESQAGNALDGNAMSLMSLQNLEVENATAETQTGVPLSLKKSGIPSGAAPSCPCGKRCTQTRRITAGQFACVRWECSKCLKMLVPEESQAGNALDGNAMSLMSLQNLEVENATAETQTGVPLSLKKSGIPSGAAPSCPCGKRCTQTRRITAGQFACVRWEYSKCLKMLVPEESQAGNALDGNGVSLMSLQNLEVENATAETQTGVPLSLKKSGIPSGAAPSCPCGKRCTQTRRITAGQFACVRWECSKCLKMLVPEESQSGNALDGNAVSLMSLQNVEVENATAEAQTGVPLSLKKSGIPSGAAPSCPCGKRCTQTRRITAGQFACVRWECSKCLKMLVPEESQAGNALDGNAMSLMSLQNLEVENATAETQTGVPLSLKKSGIPSGAAPSCPCGKHCTQTRRITAGQFACVRWECSKCLKMLVPEESQAGNALDGNAVSLMSLQNVEVENATAEAQTGVPLSLKKSGIPSGAAPSCPCGKRCAQTRRITAGQFACVRWECSKCLKMLVPEESQSGNALDGNAVSLMSLQNVEVENATAEAQTGVPLSLKKSGIPSGAAPSCPCGKRCTQTRRITAGQFACVRWECSKCLKMLVPEESQAGNALDGNAMSLMSLCHCH